MTEEVTHVVQLGARLQQPARELAAQGMEVQVDNTGPSARGAPRGLDRREGPAHLVAEHVAVGGSTSPSGSGTVQTSTASRRPPRNRPVDAEAVGGDSRPGERDYAWPGFTASPICSVPPAATTA